MRYVKFPSNIMFLGVQNPSDHFQITSSDIRYEPILELMSNFDENVDKIRDLLLFKNFISSGDLKVVDNILHYKKFPIPDEVSKYFFKREYTETQLLVICNLWVSLYTRKDIVEGISSFETAIGSQGLVPFSKDGMLMAIRKEEEAFKLMNAFTGTGITFVRYSTHYGGDTSYSTMEEMLEAMFPDMHKPLYKDFVKFLRESCNNKLYDVEHLRTVKVLKDKLNLSYDEVRSILGFPYFPRYQGQLGHFEKTLEVLTSFWSAKKVFKILKGLGPSNTSEFGDLVHHISTLPLGRLRELFKYAPKFADISQMKKWLKTLDRDMILKPLRNKYPVPLLPWLYYMKKIGEAPFRHNGDVYTYRLIESPSEMGSIGMELNHCLGSVSSGSPNYTVDHAVKGDGIFGVIQKSGHSYMSAYWRYNKDSNKISICQFYGRDNNIPTEGDICKKMFEEPFREFVNSLLQGESFAQTSALFFRYLGFNHDTVSFTSTRTSIMDEAVETISPQEQMKMVHVIRLFGQLYPGYTKRIQEDNSVKSDMNYAEYSKQVRTTLTKLEALDYGMLLTKLNQVIGADVVSLLNLHGETLQTYVDLVKREINFEEILQIEEDKDEVVDGKLVEAIKNLKKADEVPEEQVEELAG